MGYNCIRIERERGGFEVNVVDPEIEKQNRERSKGSDGPTEWKDPHVEYFFETKEQVLAFLTKAIDIALPEESYSTAFDRIAKEASNK